jgi:hypothetical protein
MERTFTKPDEGEIKESMCPLYNLQGDNPSRDKKIAFK